MFSADEALEEKLRCRLGREGLGGRQVEEQQPQEGEAVPQQRPREQALPVRPRENLGQVRGAPLLCAVWPVLLVTLCLCVCWLGGENKILE